MDRIVDTFENIIKFIKNETGITLPETNYTLVKNYIDERVRQLSITEDNYVNFIKKNKEEFSGFLDAVTINETYFFREEKHFKILEKTIFPQLFNSHKREVKLWSATCSTGEEAVSLAALSLEYLPGSGKDVVVYGTDLNPLALESFNSWVFRKNSFRKDGSKYHPLVLSQMEGDTFKITGAVKKIIKTHFINLSQEDFSFLPDDFDIIFFRNTLIYMDMGTRNAILNRLVDHCSSGGHLFLSSSEMPLISHPELKLMEKDGVYFFRKKTEEEKKQGISFDSKLIEVLDEEKPPSLRKSFFKHKPGVGPEKNSTAGKELPSVPEDSGDQTVDIEKICGYANQKCNNRLFIRESDFNYEASVFYLKILVQINGGKTSRAFSLLEETKKKYGENELYEFLKGYANMVDEKRPEADKSFFKALSINPAFWPARYYKAMLAREKNPGEALKDFIKTSEIIQKYIQEDRFTYQFLLEGFNAKYFLNICGRWIEKLRGA